MKRETIVIVGALILGLLGIWTAANGWSDLQRERALGDWSRITGVIVSSEIVGERAPHPEIQYQYSVDGVKQSGLTTLDVAGFGSKAARRDEAAKLIAQYSPGNEVSVFYNPADPAKSTLRPFPIWAAYTRLGTGIFLSISALIVGGMMLRGKGNQSGTHAES